MGTAHSDSDEIYSYHTFLLAFHCEGADITRNDVNWKEDNLINPSELFDDIDNKLNYQRVQYFTPEARELLFKKGKCYYYDLSQKSKEEKIYKIVKTKWGNSKVTYELTVNGIKAILFNDSVGAFILELENHKHHSVEAVKEINEYGRRINLPYIADDNVPHQLVADSITLLGITEDFSLEGKKLLSAKNDEEKSRSFINGYIMKPILNLLNGLITYDSIVPAIDDRMFVCCLLRDERLSKKLKSSQYIDDDDDEKTDVRDDIYCDNKLSNLIYSIGFIDATDSSCQSADMREQILRRCVYDRWRDWGTIDIITHHSMVRITGGLPEKDENGVPKFDGILASVVNPFLIQYVYLAIGALVQRAMILSLSDESAMLSDEYFKTERALDDELNETLQELKRKYVYAQSNVFLYQLTVQEQGIDEFTMLKNELYIDESLEKLDRKINSLYDFTNDYSEQKENDLLNTIAIVGLPLAILQVVTAFVDITFLNDWVNIPLSSIVGISTVICIVYFCISRVKPKKKRRKKK